MKLRTIVRIAVTSSVVLLCTGFALYSFFRLSATEDQQNFNLYTIVPPSASAIFVTDDAAEFVAEVDGLTCSKNEQYLHVSKLFSYLKQYLYTLLEDTPHGLSRQMNQVLISFHEPDNDRNQVLYCSLASGDLDLIERFVRKQVSSGYSSKIFNYKGEEITIYPLSDGHFLACYLTPDFLALSYQKKLIEEVIDARKSGKSLAADSKFAEVRTPGKSTATASIYARLEGMIGWTEFDMKLKDDFIYFSGVSCDVDTCATFINVLRQQGAVEGFPGDLLPSTTLYFSRQGVTDWASFLSFCEMQEYTKMPEMKEVQGQDKELSRYLIENVGLDLVSCLFHREDSLLGTAAVVSLSLTDADEAENRLRSLVETSSVRMGVRKNTLITICYTPKKSYSIYQLPLTTLFAQLTSLSEPPMRIYATFYEGRLLLSPDADGLSRYIHQLEAGEVLDGGLAYQAATDALSDSYQFLLMADFDSVSRQPDSQVRRVRLIPDFFFRNSEFFRHFVLFAQLTCVEGVIYPNLVLRYKAESESSGK